MIDVEKLLLNQDNLIIAKEMTDGITDEFITTGTITAQVEDKNGNVLGGPINMTYTNVDGNWVGVMPQITAVAGTRCFIVVEATSGSGFGLRGYWKEPSIFEVGNSSNHCAC